MHTLGQRAPASPRLGAAAPLAARTPAERASLDVLRDPPGPSTAPPSTPPASAPTRFSTFSLDEYKGLASAVKNVHWGGGNKRTKRPPNPRDVEKEFWKIVVGGGAEGAERMIVQAGRELDSTALGGPGFPRDPTTPYATHAWNIATWPRNMASLVRNMGSDVAAPGVLSTCLHVGMMYSSATWHLPPLYMYAIEYLHWGEAKRWYAVPGAHADRFESVYCDAYYPGTAHCAAELRSMALQHPHKLQQAGVHVASALQEEGTFILTFPRAYRAHVDCGYNCAESLAFAPPEWMRVAGEAFARSRQMGATPPFALEEILSRLAHGDLSKSPATALVAPVLRTLVQEEIAGRLRHWAGGVLRSGKLPVKKKGGPRPFYGDPTCAHCGMKLHWTALECECSPGRFACMEHGAAVCDCGKPGDRRLLFRYSNQELEEMAASVSGAHAPSLAPALPSAASSASLALRKEEIDARARAAAAGAAWVAAAEALCAAPEPDPDRVRALLTQHEQFAWGVLPPASLPALAAADQKLRSLALRLHTGGGSLTLPQHAPIPIPPASLPGPGPGSSLPRSLGPTASGLSAELSAGARAGQMPPPAPAPAPPPPLPPPHANAPLGASLQLPGSLLMSDPAMLEGLDLLNFGSSFQAGASPSSLSNLPLLPPHFMFGFEGGGAGAATAAAAPVEPSGPRGPKRVRCCFLS